MCGGGYYSAPKESKQLWKTSKDMKHVSFYAYTNCQEATEWCKAHCYMKTKPPKEKFDPDKMELEYELDDFVSIKLFKSRPFYSDFMRAKYITLFASGTLNDFVDTYSNSPYKIIKSICYANTEKIFRFFTRIKIERVEIQKVVGLPKNAVVVFSVDCNTWVKSIKWALESDTITMISIIDHPDNIMQIEYLKSKMENIITCHNCKEDSYLCFKQKQKTLLIMKYITD